MKKHIIKKRTPFAEAVKGSSMKVSFIIKESKIQTGRFYRLCKGSAVPYLHEAQRLSEVLGKPINELFHAGTKH